MQAPPESEKLRVLVIPVSDSTAVQDSGKPKSWDISYEEFSRQTYFVIEKFLSQTGIFEIVPDKEMKNVLGGTNVQNWQWEQKNWHLAKQVGSALYSDYVLIAERKEGPAFYLTLINIETGKIYSSGGALDSLSRIGSKASGGHEFNKIIKGAYREIFSFAKGNMISVAMRKGKTIKHPDVQKKISPGIDAKPSVDISDKPTVKEEPKIVKKAEPGIESKPPADTTAKPAITVEEPKIAKKVAPEDLSKQGKTKIVVYDFASTSQGLNVVALILTEALREELYKIGKFNLLNREDIMKISEELKLQQSGLVDESQAIKIGKWLNAEDAINGRVSSLGSVIVLQTKRINIKTMETVALGSIQCPVGNEEKLLYEVTKLAKELAKVQ